MKKQKFKFIVYLTILIGFLSGCADEKAFVLDGTVWNAKNDSAVKEYPDYIKFEFSKNTLNIKAVKLCIANDCNYRNEIEVNYTYDSKSQIFKVEDKFNLIKYENSPPPPEHKTGKASQILTLTVDGKDAIKNGAKVTKDTKAMDFELQTILVGQKFSVKKVK